MKDRLDILAGACGYDRGWVVLATVIRTQGSTYRQPGAKLLVRSDGRFFGILSGGCFDKQMYGVAERVANSGEAVVESFDLLREEDAILGFGVGCQGKLEVLFEPLDGKSLDEGQLKKILGISRESYSCALALERGKVTRTYDRLGIDEGVESESFLYLEKVEPQPRLFIVGHGADVGPVARMAVELGWEVHVVAAKVGAPILAPHRLHRESPGTFLGGVRFSQVDAVLIMSHDFFTDAEALGAVVERGCGYIGALGPRKRGELLKNAVGDSMGAGKSDRWENFYNPIGLDIGSETAEEIALAVIAEIQLVRHGATARSLRDRQA